MAEHEYGMPTLGVKLPCNNDNLAWFQFCYPSLAETHLSLTKDNSDEGCDDIASVNETNQDARGDMFAEKNPDEIELDFEEGNTPIQDAKILQPKEISDIEKPHDMSSAHTDAWPSQGVLSLMNQVLYFYLDFDFIFRIKCCTCFESISTG